MWDTERWRARMRVSEIQRRGAQHYKQSNTERDTETWGTALQTKQHREQEEALQTTQQVSKRDFLFSHKEFWSILVALILQVSFRKRATTHWAHLQKMTCKMRAAILRRHVVSDMCARRGENFESCHIWMGRVTYEWVLWHGCSPKASTPLLHHWDLQQISCLAYQTRMRGIMHGGVCAEACARRCECTSGKEDLQKEDCKS